MLQPGSRGTGVGPQSKGSPLKSLKFRWLVLVVSHELIVFRA